MREPRRRHPVVAALTALVLAFAPPALPLDGQGAAALEAIPPGQKLRVWTAEEWIEGYYVAVRDGQLVLDWPASTVPVTDIERLWKRDRRTGPMAIGAGGAWAGIMLSFGWVLFSFCGGFSGECDGLVEFAGVTILTTGAAAAVGAVFGSALPRWRLIHPRPPDAGKGLGVRVGQPGPLPLGNRGRASLQRLRQPIELRRQSRRWGARPREGAALARRRGALAPHRLSTGDLDPRRAAAGGHSVVAFGGGGRHLVAAAHA